jgi:hypothetical protein
LIDWLFYLDDIEIEEPIGFDEIELSIKRHETLHGITFEASTSSLKFWGSDAIDYLEIAYTENGVKAVVIFSAYQVCEGGYDYTEVLSGRLNFGKRHKSCGQLCTIELPWEQKSCAVVFNARYDQKVDVDRAVGVDNISSLQDYNGLSVETELPAHDLLVSTEGYVVDDGDVIDLDIFTIDTHDFGVRPTYGRSIYESINESQLIPSVFAASNNGFNDSVLSPVVLLDEVIGCFDGIFDYDVRMKGSYDFTYGPIANITSLGILVAWGEYPGSLTVLHDQPLPFTTDTANGTFDYIYSGTLALPQGKGFYAYMYFTGEDPLFGTTLNGSITFDKDTYVNFSGVKSCPPTNSELYMIHETLSRVSEAITNGCVRVKSDYYGRVDSEPFSATTDGCGGLRTLTSGLKIRQAQDAKFFASMKDLVEGLNAIDNIGLAVDDDPDIPGGFIARIEDVEYFYQDQEVLRHDAIPEADEQTEETRHYSKINVGYKKWEVEEVNGLDEFNSNRQYNTAIDTINSTLEITSALVAGTYPIEITRQQSFADSGGADQKYDNEIFIISMKRDDYPYLNISVEQGAVDNPENVFSPQTMYNWRLSPVRNLMRWYKSIAAGFASISDSAWQLFFSSGTGNLQAKSKMTDTLCRIENVEIRENDNIFVTKFQNSSDYNPLWRNEEMTYVYPMSLADYNAVKAQPYGYISAQCGGGEFEQFWIKEVKYKPVKGTATFILRKRYAV